MNISENWLKKWIDIPVSTEQLVNDLTMGGIEVDNVETLEKIDKVVVGKVVECKQHPNADKLKICQVDIGENILQIICGANNVRKELKVAVALIGAKLPNGLKIKETKLRGELSQGMLCSLGELGIPTNSKGILEVDKNIKVSASINDYLDIKDKVLELDITPNRGDCFSILGIARELSCYYKKTIKQQITKVNPTLEEKVEAKVIAKKECPKYLNRVIKGVDNTISTPQWMANHLLKSGIALNSAIVDITNFVMLELGQPLHAFNLKKIKSLTVRKSKGENITVLGNKEIKLDDKTLVIADNDNVLAIAGVIGGLESSVNENTTDIILESAFFTPELIAGCARKYGLHTDSSLRFERGVDYKIQQLAIDKASALIVEILGGEVSEINEIIDANNLPNQNFVEFDIQQITNILGFELKEEFITKTLTNLGFIVKNLNNSLFNVEVPSYRFDIAIVEDIAEELGRVYGYNNLPIVSLKGSNDSFDIKNNNDEILKYLVNLGFQELINYSFIDKESASLFNENNNLIELKNPISQEMALMRPSLIPKLLTSIHNNIRHGFLDNDFFEVGLTFSGIEKEQQTKKIAVVMSGNKYKHSWRIKNREVDFFDIKEILEKILITTKKKYSFEAVEKSFLQKGQSAKVFLEDKEIGYIGKLSNNIIKHFSIKDTFVFEVDFNVLLQTTKNKYKDFSNYQVSKRDLAIVVDNKISVQNIFDSINQLEQDLLIDIELFDIYKGENIDKNKKSLAFSLSYQSMDETLTDEIIEKEVQTIFNKLEKDFLAIRRA